MKIILRRIGIEDEKTVQGILEGAPKFHLIVEGCVPQKHFAVRELTELPPNTTKEQKHNLIAYQDKNPLAFIDLVDGYPDEKTAFLGLLVLPESVQAKGYGKKVFEAIEEYVVRELQKNRIRLAVAHENPVEGFWIKMGFVFDGKSKTYKGERKETTVRTMDKVLSPLHSPNHTGQRSGH